MIKMNEKKSNDILHKSRYGRESTKKKIFEVNQISSNDSSQSAIRVLPKRKRSNKLPPSVSRCILNCSLRKGTTNELSIGDIVWAKTGKYPIWPGIITSDPETKTFFKKEKKSISMLHIYYFNDAYKRNWLRLKQIFHFSGKNDILAGNPKLMKQLSRSKLKVKWSRAVQEAECLLSIKKNERLTAFFDTKFISSNHDMKSENNIQSILQKDHPRILIPELCKLFFTNGWVTGTGGGISIKYNNQIFIAPSGVQKERMEPDDIFVQDMNGADIEVPPYEKNLSKSQCTPIFMCSYIERNAGAVIHIHSPELVKLCLLNPENELRISGLEMIKGIYNEEKGRFYDNDEEVIIPIIENSKYERDLVDTFQLALMKYPSTSAVVVRNHGMYVWGSDWKSAKTQCECYEYVFNIMVFKKINNL
ncbi:methylthioribulose-1-phosphate dehydratase isoform X5 [Sipha flava]|uniref:Probable methylthioribulose-1-phosphate dehydratase n=2 Tax=Sipha flava TaxID=143950 RepID=A0A8B8FZN5_9HEMI|nr:methylthioribulose-1-phosphate dehydratase isoform X5 [Sipha flava]